MTPAVTSPEVTSVNNKGLEGMAAFSAVYTARQRSWTNTEQKEEGGIEITVTVLTCVGLRSHLTVQ